jgi:hypothetical protein
MADNKVSTTKREKATNQEVERRISLCYEFLRDGKVRGEIIEYFLKSFPYLSKISVDKYIARAKLLIANDIERDANYLVALHTKRYDEIYFETKDANGAWIDDPTEAWHFANNAHIVRRYQSALQALKQKEDIYMLHGKSAKSALISIFNPKEKSDKNKPFHLTFNIKEMKLEYLLEIKRLMDKMKVVQEKKEHYIIEDDDGEYDYQKEDSTLHKAFSDMTSKVVDSVEFNKIQTLEEVDPETNKITKSISVRGEVPEGKTLEQVSEIFRNSMRESIAKKYGVKSDVERVKEEIRKKIILSMKGKV